MKMITIGNKFDSKYDFRETCFGIVVSNNKLLVVKKKDQYSLVGGGIEKGETFKDCLEREFEEESGYAIKKIEELICIDCYWLAAGKYPMESKANIFVVEVDQINIKEPSEEGCIVEWIDINEAINKLPLPYHQKAIEYYLNEESNKPYYVYHVVTERPMELGQKIVFDDAHHSGVYNRVYEKLAIVEDIYKNPSKYEGMELEHHTKVALRELALEKLRKECYPKFPSRLSSLYVSKELDDAKSWADFFISLNRKVYQLVLLKVEGNMFTGDANNCFDGVIDEGENLKLAKRYWDNEKNLKNVSPIYETLVNGTIEVIEIIKEY